MNSADEKTVKDGKLKTQESTISKMSSVSKGGAQVSQDKKQKVADLLRQGAGQDINIRVDENDVNEPASQQQRKDMSMDEIVNLSEETIKKMREDLHVPPPPPKFGTLAQWCPRTGLKGLADSRALNFIVFSCVVLNGIQMGVQEDHHGDDLETIYNYLDNAFTFVFAVEMVIKVCAFRQEYFRQSWNCLDFMLSWMSIVDVWIISAMGESSGTMKIFSVFRMLRMLRLLRMLRMLRSCQELALIVVGFIDAMKTTVWVCTLLLAVMYIFSIFCARMIGKAEHVYEGYTKVSDDFEGVGEFNPYMLFGTIPRSMFTLLNLTFLTDDWVMVALALLEKQPVLLIILLIFVAFNNIGVLNVILGIVVEKVMESTQSIHHDDETLKKKALMHKLRGLYEFVFSLDIDNDSTISSNELTQAWDRPEMRELLSIVSLPLGADASDLVALIDADGDGMLELDEFVKNLVRLLTSDELQQSLEMKAQISRILRQVNLLEKHHIKTESAKRGVMSAAGGCPRCGKVCEEIQAFREEQRTAMEEIKMIWREMQSSTTKQKHDELSRQLKRESSSEHAQQTQAAKVIQRKYRSNTPTDTVIGANARRTFSALDDALAQVQEALPEEEPEAEGDIVADVKETTRIALQKLGTMASNFRKDGTFVGLNHHHNPNGFWPKIHRPQSFKELAQSPVLTTSVWVCISLNAIQMGVATDHDDDTTKSVFFWFDNVFTALFALEMVIKICAWRKEYFKDTWNCFDFTLSWLGIVDVWILSQTSSGSDIKIFSVLRTLRMLRAIRLLRMLKHFRQLALLVVGFINAMKTTMWVCLLLFILIYIFSILCTKLIGKSGIYEGYAEEGFGEDEFNPYQYFGTITRSMFTLLNFTFMTGYWDAVSRPLFEKQPALISLFIIFVAFSNLGLFNVIVGIVCESVAESTAVLKEDKECVHKSQLLGRLHILYHFVFSLDTTDDQQITTEELTGAWNRPEMQEIRSMMRLPLGAEASDLVDLLDVNGDGALGHEELVKSMVRLLTNTHYQQMLELKVGLNRVMREVRKISDSLNQDDEDDPDVATSEDEVSKQLREVRTQQSTINTMAQQIRLYVAANKGKSLIAEGTPVFKGMGGDTAQPNLPKSMDVGASATSPLQPHSEPASQAQKLHTSSDLQSPISSSPPITPEMMTQLAPRPKSSTPPCIDRLLIATPRLGGGRTRPPPASAFDSPRSTMSGIFGSWREPTRSPPSVGPSVTSVTPP